MSICKLLCDYEIKVLSETKEKKYTKRPWQSSECDEDDRELHLAAS